MKDGRIAKIMIQKRMCTMNEIKNIYSTVPNEAFNAPEAEIQQRAPILNFLKENTGRFYTAREIAKECNLPTRGTQVEVRKAITLLLEIDGQPIMSNAKGFGYVTNACQMDFYANQLQERAQGL